MSFSTLGTYDPLTRAAREMATATTMSFILTVVVLTRKNATKLIMVSCRSGLYIVR